MASGKLSTYIRTDGPHLGTVKSHAACCFTSEGQFIQTLSKCRTKHFNWKTQLTVLIINRTTFFLQTNKHFNVSPPKASFPWSNSACFANESHNVPDKFLDAFKSVQCVRIPLNKVDYLKMW